MLTFIMFSILTVCTSQNHHSLRVFDFFGNGIKDDSRIRYGILRNNLELDVGREMTICSSIYMRSFIMEQSLFQVLTGENKPWFSLYFLQLDENSMTFPFSLAVSGIYIHLAQVQAIPLQWNHACIGIDTDKGGSFNSDQSNDIISRDGRR